MGSSEQSKTSGLKSLLLRAWRERWSDVQWSIAVKRLLSPQASENQHLAGLLEPRMFVAVFVVFWSFVEQNRPGPNCRQKRN